MDFSLSDSEVMIRDSCRHFMAQRYTLEEWTKVADNQGFSSENWGELAKLGYLAIDQPEAYGGIGGPAELAIVCQEFGRGLLLEPFLGSAVLSAKLIAEAGSQEQKDELLPAIVNGQSIVAVAHSEPETLDGTRLSTTARPEAGGYVVSGRKSLVLAGLQADRIVVSATIVEGAAEAGTVLLLVDPNQDGVTRHPTPLLDHSWAAEIGFHKVIVTADRVLGKPDQAQSALDVAVRHAQFAACAEMVGIVDRAVEIAADYLKSRSQFGVTLSTFQALRHKIADMAIDRELARSTLNVFLAAIQRGHCKEQVATAAAMAKAQLGEIGRRVCAQAIQLHGAMGMTSECGVGRYFARANVINSLVGQTDIQFSRYAHMLANELKQGNSGND